MAVAIAPFGGGSISRCTRVPAVAAEDAKMLAPALHNAFHRLNLKSQGCAAALLSVLGALAVAAN